MHQPKSISDLGFTFLCLCEPVANTSDPKKHDDRSRNNTRNKKMRNMNLSNDLSVTDVIQRLEVWRFDVLAADLSWF